MTPTTPAASVRDVELSAGIRDLPAAGGENGRQAWLFVHLFTEPIGLTVVDLDEEPIPAGQVLTRILDDHGTALDPRLAAVGESRATLTTDGLSTTSSSFTQQREEILADGPAWTVVVCTRDRPAGLRRTLEGLTGQEYPDFRVLVVDNASATAETRQVVEAYSSRLRIEYVQEPRPGLSRARNRALAEAQTALVAWLDDDAVADPFWLAELTRGFVLSPEASAVSGVVVPLALETPEQLLFEQFGGHSKGRGFTRDVFSPESATRQSPLYPLPAFGVGANMAFRTEALRAIGGFDEALGAGTRTFAGEDTKAFTQLLLRGGTMVYQPSAVVRHLHRADMAGLEKQLVGYGTGLTAFYTAMVMDRPSIVWSLLALVRPAVRDLFSSDSVRTATVGVDFPQDVLRANRRAMASGPLRYLRARSWDVRRGQTAPRHCTQVLTPAGERAPSAPGPVRTLDTTDVAATWDGRSPEAHRHDQAAERTSG